MLLLLDVNNISSPKNGIYVGDTNSIFSYQVNVSIISRVQVSMNRIFYHFRMKELAQCLFSMQSGFKEPYQEDIQLM